MIASCRFARQSCVAILVLTAAGCKHQQEETQSGPDLFSSHMPSTVRMNDARTARQLLSGFYGIENGAWRWTAKQFALNLGPPAGAAQKGALLELKLTVPPVTIEKLQSVTLAGSVNGTAFAPETYSKPGQYTFDRDIPASILTGDSAKVSFELDKAMPPAGGDIRELGIIVSMAALHAK